MSYAIEFSKQAERDLRRFKKSAPALFAKAVALLNEISLHPFTGTGHPEPLRGGDGVTWSRRISKGDRIIYDVYRERVTVLVIEVGGHYGD